MMDAPRRGRGASASSYLARFVSTCSLITCLALSAAASEPRASDKAVLAQPALEYQLAPSGEWLAIWTVARGETIARAWVVSLEDGEVRPLDRFALTGSELAWDESGKLRFQVVDRAHGTVEMDWLDVETDRVVESTRDRVRMRAELAPDSWAKLERRKLIDGRASYLVTWLENGKTFECNGVRDIGGRDSSGRGVECQISEQPGLVFYSQQDAQGVELRCHDLAQGLSRKFADLGTTLVSWSVGPTGRGVLVVENGVERRARVIDTQNGMLLYGPWAADDAAWIEGAGGRYVALTRGTRKLVYDTVRDRALELAADEGAWPRVIALEDGRFVVEDQGRIQLCDDRLQSVRTLFEGAASPQSR